MTELTVIGTIDLPTQLTTARRLVANVRNASHCQDKRILDAQIDELETHLDELSERVTEVLEPKCGS